MSETYSIRLEKQPFIFSAAHFITYNGNVCERLHGHNYRVFVECDGPLDENQYVLDFIALRDTVLSLVTELDHRTLLPLTHPQIRIAENTTEVEARFEDRRWVFPRDDCALLPLANTTAELLARYLGQRLAAELKRRYAITPTRLRLGVDENEGQWGIWEAYGSDLPTDGG